jgi:hypothetical protein
MDTVVDDAQDVGVGNGPDILGDRHHFGGRLAS